MIRESVASPSLYSSNEIESYPSEQQYLINALNRKPTPPDYRVPRFCERG